MSSRIGIASGWEYCQLPSKIIPDPKKEWSPCVKFPTTAHVELIKAGKIPHPFKGLAEWDVQWVQEADWGFRTTFSASEEDIGRTHADLIFEGLDTYCDVYLNGTLLVSTDNMYLEHRLDIKKKLKSSNELFLHFRSPQVESMEEMERHPDGPRALFNGTPNRLYSRKSGYHWGWDWGPIIMCVGPWRPVHLETYSVRFGDIRVDTFVRGADYSQARLSAIVEVISEGTSHPSDIHVKLAKRDDGFVIRKGQFQAGQPISWDFSSGEVDLWWPTGYGKQSLYVLSVEVRDQNKTLISRDTRVAFRDAQIVQEALEEQDGTSFLFQVNGVRMFCGGSNWIPADSFYTEIEPERYRRWVKLMVKGNQNMLRIWGGGIYEEEALYDVCDELGVLVWQDFMFGCGLYPSYDKVNKSIELEAEQTVKRLRNHPSVVIFAGNNEDYQVAEEQGVVDYEDESGDYLNTKFPGRHIYEIILPSVVERHSNIFYWRASPYGGKKTVADQTVGDIHQWNVWHGSQEPWANWDKLAGRFVSEFGMQGYPDLKTVMTWDEKKDQLFPQSRVSVNHNKADGFERRLELYLMENFRHAFDMPSYVYYTQIMQAECLATAYRLWRRNWKGKGREYTAGALVWQLNDCWPCVSWAIVDYYLRPKPSFYAIKRELEQYTVGITRKDHKKYTRKHSLAFYEIEQEIQIWGCNSTLESKQVNVELTSFDLEDGVVDTCNFDVKLLSNSSTEIFKGRAPCQPVRNSDAEAPRSIIYHARLLEKGKVLARYSNWPEPWKYLTFADPGLQIRVDGDRVELSCSKPIKGIVLAVEDGSDPEVAWSDQGIDLFPGDDQVVAGKDLKGRKVRARHIGDGSA